MRLMRAFKACLDTLLLLECDLKQHSQACLGGNDTPGSQRRLANGEKHARKMLIAGPAF